MTWRQRDGVAWFDRDTMPTGLHLLLLRFVDAALRSKNATTEVEVPCNGENLAERLTQ